MARAGHPSRVRPATREARARSTAGAAGSRWGKAARRTKPSAAARRDALGEGQTRILEMIASGAPLGGILEALVRLIESEIPGVLGSILLLDEDGAHLHHGAAPSLPPAFCRAIDSEPIGPSAGSCGTAAYRGAPVVVEDIQSDALWSAYRSLAAAHGLRACWSTPIMDDRRKVLGTFAMYFRSPGRPAARHLRVIEIATHTAAIAIVRTRDERERGRLVRDLGERVKELTILHEAARLLQAGRAIDVQFLFGLAALLPRAWQYPEVCEARIVCGDMHASTPGWRATPWMQSARFATGYGTAGAIEIAYREERPAAADGPFLAEETRLIRSLADLLSAHLERAQTQAALRESETMFRSIFENAAIGMTLVNMQEQLVSCNPALARLLGYQEAELVGGTFAAFTHPDDIDDNRELYRALAAGKIDHFQIDKRYVRKDGRLVWAQLTVSLVPAAGNGPRLTIGVVEDITARREAEERVRHLAYYEPLTDLPNRASLHLRLVQELAEARGRNRTLVLLLVNLNNFRDINDTLGHQNGDALLRQVAVNLRAALWQSDLVACLGGDEYAILLTRLADRADLARVLDKISGSLKRPINVAGIPVNVEATLGIALFPEHGDSPDTLWRHADVALRAAKERQQGQAFYGPDIDHYDPRRLSLLGELGDAIGRSQLVLHYQPKIDLKTQSAVGVEALVRWQHPAHGMIYPDRFVPLAERTYLINPLTTWVLGKALRQGRIWRDGGLPLELSVNLSARNLHDPELSAGILDLARSSGFPLEHLTVELTESAIMADPALARGELARLHEAGICIAMDDFGIGQSSLAYLKDLPISRMKIDKSFVIDFRNPRNAAIVRSAIELAHNLGLAVTAEGVEDEEVFHALRDLGCDLAQGYYCARPMPVDQVTTWLRESRWMCRPARAVGD